MKCLREKRSHCFCWCHAWLMNLTGSFFLWHVVNELNASITPHCVQLLKGMRQKFLFELFSKQVTFVRRHDSTQFPTQLLHFWCSALTRTQPNGKQHNSWNNHSNVIQTSCRVPHRCHPKIVSINSLVACVIHFQRNWKWKQCIMDDGNVGRAPSEHHEMVSPQKNIRRGKNVLEKLYVQESVPSLFFFCYLWIEFSKKGPAQWLRDAMEDNLMESALSILRLQPHRAWSVRVRVHAFRAAVCRSA